MSEDDDATQPLDGTSVPEESTAVVVGRPKKAKVQKPSRARQRAPLRSEVNTATAQPEHRRPRPIGSVNFNPIHGDIAPLRPEDTVVDVDFRFGTGSVQRRYNSRIVHGVIDYHYNAEDHPATAEYARRIEEQPLGGPDPGYDPLLENELVQRMVDQPPALKQQFRQDLRNPDFLDRVASRAVVPSSIPPALLHRLAEQEATARMTSGAVAAMTAARVDADFFTSLPGYNVPEQLSAAKRQAAMQADRDSFNAILDGLDRELDDIEVGDDLRVAALRKERDELVAAQRVREPLPAITNSSHTDTNKEVETDLPMADAIQQQLFATNPLASLPQEMRGDFMQLPEVSAVWRMLMPIVLQHERRRQHYNAIEFVRALDLCGAKFAGLNRLTIAAPLARLVDKDVYADRIDPDTGVLRGGHEHFNHDTARTTVLVFKFYLVRNDKKNVSLLRSSVATHNKESGNDNAKKLDVQNKEADQFMKLNRRGLYDLDDKQVGAEDDGTGEYGPMHHIKYPEREFIFCLSVVCVEPPAAECIEAEIECPSEDDEVPSGTTTTTARGGDDDEEDEDDERLRSSGFNDLQLDDEDDLRDDDDEQQPMERDQTLFVHSDDEAEPVPDDLVTHTATPSNKVMLTKKESEMWVGKWKAELFTFQVNTRVINQLCVRAFRFYTDADVERKEDPKKKKK